MSKNISRKAYLLTTDFESERTIFSSEILSNIGFDVILVQHIYNENKVLSNKFSMLHIYSLIKNGNDDYSYIFEDDINMLEDIKLSEIVEYEEISPIFFYLGCCLINRDKIINTSFKINNHDVFNVSGNVRGLHAIGLSKIGAEKLIEFSNNMNEYEYMDVILENFCNIHNANIVRYDLESYIYGHVGIIYQDRMRFPSTI
jgi:hypothetical protein